MQLQAMTFSILSESFFLESNLICDSNMWISAFFFLFRITRTSLYLAKQAKASLKFSRRSKLSLLTKF